MESEVVGGLTRRPFSASVTITQSLIIGLATGLLDAALIQMDIDGRAVFYLTPWLWFWVPLIWTSFCLAIGIVFLTPVIRPFSWSALIAAGPGLLLFSRGLPVLRQAAHLSTAAAGVACLVVVAILVALCSRIRLPSSVVSRPYTTALIVCGALIVAIGKGAVAHSTMSASAPVRAGDSQRANLVLVFLDTMRYDDARTLTNLVNFESSSIVFDNAWAPTPWTLPSHFAVLTGADPSGVDFATRFRQFSGHGATLAQQLASHGYATGAVFANPLLNPRNGFARGFQSMNYSQSFDGCRSGLAYLLNSATVRAFGGNIGICGWMTASEVVQKATAFVDRSKRPYFLAVNFIDPHAPYYVEPQCRDRDEVRYTRSDWALFDRLSRSGGALPAPAAMRIRSQYQSAIRCMDRSLGHLMNHLNQQPDRQRTIIAIVGDHGEQFGEHGFVGHGNSVYGHVLHVPLILNVPGIQARHVIEPVSISNLHETFLEAANVPQKSARTLFSEDRGPVWASIFPDTSVWSVVDRNYHVLRWADGREEIYDYRTDPSEVTPLAIVDDTRIRELRAALFGRQYVRPKGSSAFQGLGYLQ